MDRVCNLAGLLDSVCPLMTIFKSSLKQILSRFQSNFIFFLQLMKNWPLCCRVTTLQDFIRPVRELHTPPTPSSESLIIIFFHGISLGNNDDYKKTWMTCTKDPKDSECWPEKWLPTDLGPEKVRILSLTYDARLVGANDDVTEIGKNLVQTLVIRYVISSHQIRGAFVFERKVITRLLFVICQNTDLS